MKTDIVGHVTMCVQIPVGLYQELKNFCFRANISKKALIVEGIKNELRRKATRIAED